MPRKRKEEPEAPKVIPELEALPPRRRKFVEAYTDPRSPTYSNATKSIQAVSPNITYGSARELGSSELAKVDTGNAIKAVLAACGASEGNLAALMWEYAQDRHHGVRSSSVRATETLMRVSGIRPLVMFSTGLVNTIRGIPIIVQLFYIYFVFPEIGITLTALQAGILGLGIAYSAYQSENFRLIASSVLTTIDGVKLGLLGDQVQGSGIIGNVTQASKLTISD